MNYFNEPFTEAKLAELARKTADRPIKMMRGAAAAGFDENTPDSKVIAAMVADPNLIQRPILEVGERAVVARPIEKALALISSGPG